MLLAVLDLPGCIRARRRCTRHELPSCLPQELRGHLDGNRQEQLPLLPWQGALISILRASYANSYPCRALTRPARLRPLPRLSNEQQLATSTTQDIPYHRIYEHNCFRAIASGIVIASTTRSLLIIISAPLRLDFSAMDLGRPCVRTSS